MMLKAVVKQLQKDLKKQEIRKEKTFSSLSLICCGISCRQFALIGLDN